MTLPKGRKHWNWNGGFYVNAAGYKLLNEPDHHKADSKGYVYEHMVVMEKKMGRQLLPGETIHHINHDKSDNRPENLMLFPTIAEHLNYEKQIRHDSWKTFGRICPRCKQQVSPADLTKSLKTCRPCEGKRHLAWREKNRTKQREYWALYRATHR